ncbi:MAG TPA: HAD hydrolase-like protein [bacterium]|jgi:phosphoglycolate phosphatase|nr:HAD hydrolase-like protein [bacterium]
MNALFDLDGTLCDPREGIVQGFQHAFDAVGEPFPGPGAVGPLIGRPLLQCFQTLGLGGRSAEGARHFQAFFESRGFAEATLYPGILDCLKRLKREGWGVAVASAKPGFAVKFVAESLQILPWLDGHYGCEAEELSPDKAGIVAQAMQGLGWAAGETLLIGDRDQDRDAARTHGLGFVAAAWGFGAAEEHHGAFLRVGQPEQLLDALLLARSRR